MKIVGQIDQDNAKSSKSGKRVFEYFLILKRLFCRRKNIDYTSRVQEQVDVNNTLPLPLRQISEKN